MPEMLALSIQQPWPWLITHGYKDVENRTWWTKVRGEIALHAGQKVDADGYNWVRRTFPHIELPRTFEVGGIVGTARLVDCVRESESRWFHGPYGFVLADAKPCAFLPMRGQIGFFKVDVKVDVPECYDDCPPGHCQCHDGEARTVMRGGGRQHGKTAQRGSGDDA